MRRKSERTATKKAKPSPEKKLDKTKRGRSRRGRKPSSSSEQESADEVLLSQQTSKTVSEPEQQPPHTPVKEDSPEESQEVWQVKTSEGSGDNREIQKLKICLTRPPTTPERPERSPKSKRKHSRATSSSDTQSETPDDKKKSKHKSKRSARESKDDYEKSQDSQGDDVEAGEQPSAENEENLKQDIDSKSNVQEETPMSTTNEGDKIKPSDEDCETKEVEKDSGSKDIMLDADTTVVSPKLEQTVSATFEKNENDTVNKEKKSDFSVSHQDKDKTSTDQKKGSNEAKDSDEVKESDETNDSTQKAEEKSSSPSQAEDNPSDAKESSVSQSDSEIVKQDTNKNQATFQEESAKHEELSAPQDNEVSNTEEHKTCRNISDEENISIKIKNSTNKTDVVESSEKRCVRNSLDYNEHDHKEEIINKTKNDQSANNIDDDINQSEQTTPFVVSRKRRWGSRPNKVTSQKSITISTDILKEIIPDVKPTEFDEVIEDKKHKRIEMNEKLERPVLPKIVIDNTESVEQFRREKDDRDKENSRNKDSNLGLNRKISIVKDNDNIIARPPSPPRHKPSNILFITNLVRPFTQPQLKNLLQRTGRITEDGFWIDRIKSKCFVKYENEDQAVETRHALHGVTWPVSNPKTLQVDFSSQEAFDKAKANEDTDNAQASTIPGTVEDWLREQDMKRERGEPVEKPWEKKTVREWDVGKNDKEKEVIRREEMRPLDKRRHRSPERSPEPARKFKKKEEEAPAKLLDDLFRKTKTTPCIYWLPLSAETIAIKEEQRRQHMAEHERRLLELRRVRRH